MKSRNLIPTKEVADRLGLTHDAVLKRVQAGTLTYAAKAPGKRGAYMFDPKVIDKITTNQPS